MDEVAPSTWCLTARRARRLTGEPSAIAAAGDGTGLRNPAAGEDAPGAPGAGLAPFGPPRPAPPRRAGTTTTTTCGVVSVARERRCVPRALRDVREVEVVGGGRRGPGRKPNEMAIGVGKANLFLPINFSPSLWLALKSNLDGNPT